MKANFYDIHSAADYIGPGAIEVPLYQTEITDIVRRNSIFGQRIKQVPATCIRRATLKRRRFPIPARLGLSIRATSWLRLSRLRAWSAAFL